MEEPKKKRVKEIVGEFSPWDFDGELVAKMASFSLAHLKEAMSDGFEEPFLEYDPNGGYNSFKIWAWREENSYEEEKRLDREAAEHDKKYVGGRIKHFVGNLIFKGVWRW